MSVLSPLTFAKSLVPEAGPQRMYVTSSFVGTVGGGIMMPISVLYFTRIVGLSSAKVGLAFTVSSLIAILMSAPAGALADRVGPRRVVMGSLALLAASGLAYLLVQNFLTLLVVNACMDVSFAAYFPSVGALLRRVGGEQTVTIRSQSRAVANIGVAFGSLVSGAGIQIGTAAAYHVLIVLFGAAQTAALILLFRVPDYRPLPRPEKDSPDDDHPGPAVDAAPDPKGIALRDKAFVAYALVGGAMTVQSLILEIMIPVWIVGHTDAPSWGVTLAFIINTALVVLLQVRLGGSVQTLGDGGVALRRAGIALMLGCAAISLMAAAPAWAALLVLAAGMALLTLGEIWYASGTFAFDYGLPPAYAQGQYQGLSGTASGAARAVAPVFLLGVVLDFGSAGWIGLGAIMLFLGLTGPALARFGARTRPAERADGTGASATAIPPAANSPVGDTA
ncbi:MFS transporter [Actinacidiphila sp. DG2A-62]|uniref:MFS transporter n=1 Tax=Actinacidiphila sp. DG2A-62 TaxID=3108821 RepID=UPI002DBFDC08|nr:MFS transporter [Actinacidiphila sp. DG2A-62]MEC3993099.1 MFS transporter [Actinacidiphila sp. DG2A-62]